MRPALRFLLGAMAVIALALAITFLPRLLRPASDPVIEEAELMAENAPTSPELQALDSRLSELGDTFDGQVGIAVVDIAQDASVHYNGLQQLPQQSVTKLWVALTAFVMVDRGELDLSETVAIMRDDLTLFHQPLRAQVLKQGIVVTDFGDLLQRAIITSDNTANDRLLQRVGGPDAVQAFLDNHELGSIRFGSDERTKQSRIAGLAWRPSYSYGNSFFEARGDVPDGKRREAFESYLADPEDGASAVAIAQAFASLSRGELLSDRSTQELLGILSRTRSGPRRLKGAVPPDWAIAHKTGTGQYYAGEQSGYNDIGLITSPEGKTYAVAVLIGRTRAPNPRRMELMQRVVHAVLEYDAVRNGKPPPAPLELP